MPEEPQPSNQDQKTATLPEQTPAEPSPSPTDLTVIPAEIVDGDVIIATADVPAIPQTGRIYLGVKHTEIKTNISSVNYSGGLPPPEFLQIAEQYYPGATKEIFDEYRQEREHRQYIEKTTLHADIGLSRWGLAAGTLMLLSSLWGSLYMFMMGNIKGGTASLGLSGIIMLLGYFIKVTRAKREDLQSIPEPKQPQPEKEPSKLPSRQLPSSPTQRTRPMRKKKKMGR